MKIKSLLLFLCLFLSIAAQADDQTDKTVGLSNSSSGTHLTFNVADQPVRKNDGSYVGLRGEIPLSDKARAMEGFRESMGKKSNVEIYGQVDVGYQKGSKDSK